MTPQGLNDISRLVLSAAIEVHSALGLGLLESAYELALSIEFTQRGIPFERQVPLPATYKGVDLGSAYRLDFLVEDLVVIEVKTVIRLMPIHTAQLLTYLRLSNRRLGLLLNFHAESMRAGVRRVVSDKP